MMWLVVRGGRVYFVTLLRYCNFGKRWESRAEMDLMFLLKDVIVLLSNVFHHHHVCICTSSSCRE